MLHTSGQDPCSAGVCYLLAEHVKFIRGLTVVSLTHHLHHRPREHEVYVEKGVSDLFERNVEVANVSYHVRYWKNHVRYHVRYCISYI